ncbi:coiled-coil domain-containing protein [Sphingobacterium puteale]|uniref:coiled-coil domain-containing protein n=1 Tax=Sphingobacterium puteale TaxID=2420510 RepID=UPI003D99FB21
MNENNNTFISKNIEKFTDIFIEPVRQRTAHPFISSYFISAIFVNWKAFTCLIFSSKIIEEKINYIEATFYPDDNSKTFALLIPFLIALLYTTVLKWFDIFIDAVNNVPIHYRIVNQAKIKASTLEAQIDIVRAQIKLNNARAENKELQELNDRIKALQTDVEAKEDIIKQRVSEVERFSGLVSDLSKEVSLLKVEQNDMALASMHALSVKTDYESVINLLLTEINETTLNTLLDKVRSAKYPASVKNLIDSVSKKTRYKDMFDYKIVLIDKLTQKDEEMLKMELLRVDNRIAIEKTIDIRGGKEVFSLEVYYPLREQEKEVKIIVDKYVTRSL